MTFHFNQFPQRGCQSTVHKLRNPLIYCEFDSKKFWRGGPKKSKPPRGTTHPRPPRIAPIYISIDSSQSQDPEYIILNGIDVQKLCSLGAPVARFFFVDATSLVLQQQLSQIVHVLHMQPSSRTFLSSPTSASSRSPHSSSSSSLPTSPP